MTNFEFLDILKNNLSLESKWFLVILSQQSEAINKEQLKELANNLYTENEKKKGKEVESGLITSRHSLDIHTARLEGSGLVQVKEVGRARFYSITDLGKALLEYIRRNPINN